MRVKELIERLQEFNQDTEVFYDDNTYGPINVDEVYETEIYREHDGMGGYHYTKMKGDEKINCVYIE